MPTSPLRTPPPRHPLEFWPLARAHDGHLILEQAAFPPTGPVHLVLWRPGGDPPLSLHTATITRGPGPAEWRAQPGLTGYILLWTRAGDGHEGF